MRADAAALARDSDSVTASAASVEPPTLEGEGEGGSGGSAPMRAWAEQAVVAMDLLAAAARALLRLRRRRGACGASLHDTMADVDSGADAEAALPLELERDALLACTPFATPAPWSFPAAHAAAARVFGALAGGDGVGGVGVGGVGGGDDLVGHGSGTGDGAHAPPVSRLRALHAIVARRGNAPFLLEWCRARSVGGRWRDEPALAAVRWVTLGIIGAVRAPHMRGDVLAHSLTLALRLGDAAEPSAAWSKYKRASARSGVQRSLKGP